MSTPTKKTINIAGKDYFTQDEAAFYVGCSLSQWKNKHQEYRLEPFPFMGKQLYRKVDLQRAIEYAWQQSTGAVKTEPPPTYNGMNTDNALSDLSAKFSHTKLRQLGLQKN